MHADDLPEASGRVEGRGARDDGFGKAGPGDWKVALAVALATLLLHGSGALYELPGMKSVVGATRILDGDVPYRDFWSMYAPGQFYAVAGLFRLFGRELFVQALAVVAIQAVAAATLFLLVRSIGVGRAPGCLLALLFAAMLWRTDAELTSYPPALLFLLVGLKVLVRYFGCGGRRRLLAAGLCFGVAAWFKHDVGAYAAAGSVLAVCLAALRRERPVRWPGPLAAGAWLGAGALLAVVPVAVWLGRVGGMDAWEDLIVFPATTFRAVRSEPYAGWIPDLEPVLAWSKDPTDLWAARGAALRLAAWGLCVWPQVAFLAAVLVLVLRRFELRPESLAVTLLALCLGLPFWMAAHVQQNTHLDSMALCAMLLGALAWARGPRRGAKGALTRAVVLLLALPYGATLLIRPATGAYAMLQRWSSSEPLALPGARFVRIRSDHAEDYRAVVSFVEEHVPEDEPIYVGLTRHDAPVIANQRVYYLTRRRPCGRYNELHPGVTDRPDVQREIIASLESERVRCVVLFEWGSSEQLDGVKANLQAAVEDGGAELLDDYIRGQFEEIGRHGKLQLLWRRSALGDLEEQGRSR